MHITCQNTNSVADFIGFTRVLLLLIIVDDAVQNSIPKEKQLMRLSKSKRRIDTEELWQRMLAVTPNPSRRYGWMMFTNASAMSVYTTKTWNSFQMVIQSPTFRLELFAIWALAEPAQKNQQAGILCKAKMQGSSLHDHTDKFFRSLSKEILVYLSKVLNMSGMKLLPDFRTGNVHFSLSSIFLSLIYISPCEII